MKHVPHSLTLPAAKLHLALVWGVLSVASLPWPSVEENWESYKVYFCFAAVRSVKTGEEGGKSLRQVTDLTVLW